MMRRSRAENGFTLVELLLAMSFLSILLLAIAMLVINITNIYTRGVTLTTIQRAGEAISSELQQVLNQAQPDNVDYIKFPASGSKAGTNGGRLCTGTVTYAWNNSRAITSTDSAYSDVNKYSDGTKNIRFIKLQDNGGLLCGKSGSSYPTLNKSQATDLIVSVDRTIGLYAFTLSPKSIATSAQTIYSINMTIGTDGSEVINGNTQCAPPSGGSDSFCAVNQFVFTVRASTQDAGGGN